MGRWLGWGVREEERALAESGGGGMIWVGGRLGKGGGRATTLQGRLVWSRREQRLCTPLSRRKKLRSTARDKKLAAF
jgi:hypothetical protein